MAGSTKYHGPCIVCGSTTPGGRYFRKRMCSDCYFEHRREVKAAPRVPTNVASGVGCSFQVSGYTLVGRIIGDPYVLEGELVVDLQLLSGRTLQSTPYEGLTFCSVEGQEFGEEDEDSDCGQ